MSSDDGVFVPQLDNKTSSVLPVHYRFVQCTGVEKRLIDCAHGMSPADHEDCKRNKVDKYLYGTVTCSESKKNHSSAIHKCSADFN